MPMKKNMKYNGKRITTRHIQIPEETLIDVGMGVVIILNDMRTPWLHDNW